ncbi:MAG TPA: hypothetical protein VF743_08795, partial [Acidimicrobiales bacterium]
GTGGGSGGAGGGTNPTLWIALGVAVAVALVVIALVATSGGGGGDDAAGDDTGDTTGTTDPDTTEDTTPDPGGGYSPAFESAFVESCSAEGATRDQCQCAYDSIEAEIPFDEFNEMIAQMPDDPTDLTSFPEELQTIMFDCALPEDASST